MDQRRTQPNGTTLWDQQRKRIGGRDSKVALLRPCTDGGHETCGCLVTAYRCCLRCPLPTCVYDEVDRSDRQRVRVTTPDTKGAERGLQIVLLLHHGRTPHEIRGELGLSTAQYIRAIKKHEENTGEAVQQPTTRTEKVRIAVRHLLETKTLEPRHRIELITHFGFRSRMSVDRVIQEERRRLDHETMLAGREHDD